MKLLIKILLWVNTIMEGGFGLYLCIFPNNIYQALRVLAPMPGASVMVPRMYGLTAMCIGVTV
jgi:hypothetical protein